MLRLPPTESLVPRALWALLWLALACGPGNPSGSGERSGNDDSSAVSRPSTIVLVSLDTLRPERLGLYGGPADVSPVLDALARESVVFDTATSSAPWTLPSHMTMLTGLDPVAHGVLNDTMQLSEKVPTLAGRLSDAGYATGAFTDGGFVSGRYGFNRGFDVFDDQRAEDGPNGFPRIMPLALQWLGDQIADDDQDVFLFLHTFDAHAPYDEVAPEILERFRRRAVVPDDRDAGLRWLGFFYKQAKMGVNTYARLGELLNDYDAGIYEADLYLGQLFETLRAAGRWDDALIIVTSDHGESFLDHGLHVGHGLLLNDSELHVPLIVKLPGEEGAGRRFDELVGLIDIPRTVLELGGLSAGEDIQGESLLGLVKGYQRSADSILGLSQNIRSFTLITEDYKYISPVGIRPMTIAEKHLGPTTPPGFFPATDEQSYTLDNQELSYDVARDPLGLTDVLPAAEQLFDRRRDPGEQHNLVTSQASKLAEMRRTARLRYGKSEQLNKKFPTGEVGEDRATQAVLKTLGYLGSGDRTELKGTSKAFRNWALQAEVPPDTEQLASTDRRVHELRLILEGDPAAQAQGFEQSEMADKLKAAAIDYDTWGKRNPRFVARVYWRVLEVVRLAQLAEVTFSSPPWLAKAQEDAS